MRSHPWSCTSCFTPRVSCTNHGRGSSIGRRSATTSSTRSCCRAKRQSAAARVSRLRDEQTHVHPEAEGAGRLTHGVGHHPAQRTVLVAVAHTAAWSRSGWGATPAYPSIGLPSRGSVPMLCLGRARAPHRGRRRASRDRCTRECRSESVASSPHVACRPCGADRNRCTEAVAAVDRRLGDREPGDGHSGGCRSPQLPFEKRPGDPTAPVGRRDRDNADRPHPDLAPPGTVRGVIQPSMVATAARRPGVLLVHPDVPPAPRRSFAPGRACRSSARGRGIRGRRHARNPRRSRHRSDRRRGSRGRLRPVFPSRWCQRVRRAHRWRSSVHTTDGLRRAVSAARPERRADARRPGRAAARERSPCRRGRSPR